MRESKNSFSVSGGSGFFDDFGSFVSDGSGFVSSGFVSGSFVSSGFSGGSVGSGSVLSGRLATKGETSDANESEGKSKNLSHCDTSYKIGWKIVY